MFRIDRNSTYFYYHYPFPYWQLGLISILAATSFVSNKVKFLNRTDANHSFTKSASCYSRRHEAEYKLILCSSAMSETVKFKSS